MRIVLAAAVVAATVTAHAARAQSSAIVLQLPASARGAAMGNAQAAAVEGDAALFYNPAQLAADRRRMSAGFSMQRYIEGSNTAALSAAADVGVGRAAIGLQALDFGSEPELVPDPDFGGERGMETGADVGAREIVATAGYAIRVGAVTSGVGVKIINQQVADLGGSTGALDIGVAVKTLAGTIAGVMQNSGGTMRVGQTSARLPLVYRGGFETVPVAIGSVRLTAAAELSRYRDAELAWSSGAEISLPTARGVTASARTGLRARHHDGAGSRFTFGGGLAMSRLAVDYAYQTVEGLEMATHRIGVRWWRKN